MVYFNNLLQDYSLSIDIQQKIFRGYIDVYYFTVIGRIVVLLSQGIPSFTMFELLFTLPFF